MANKEVWVQLNKAEVGRLLKSQELADGLLAIASDIADRCGAGYESESVVMKTRVISSVYTATFDAMRDNTNNDTILRALS